MPIYTKKGDRGETGLPGGRRKLKTDPLFEFLGTLDQTSATLGVAVSFMEEIDRTLKKQIQQVQSDLLNIGICLASENPSKQPFLSELAGKVLRFEKDIDSWESKIGELKNFIILGGTKAGANLHLARTISRKAERDFHRINSEKPKEISKYLNRLSDYLFQAARYINNQNNSTEQNWNKFQNTEKNS